jgi:hypothetical protein
MSDINGDDAKELLAYAREVRERLYGHGGDNDQLFEWLKTASPEDIALLTYVLSQLAKDYDESNLYDPTTLTVSPEVDREVDRLLHEGMMYDLAKAKARSGESKELIRILTIFALRQLNRSFDPELADLITGKTQPRRRRSPVVNILKAEAYDKKCERSAAVKRIREIIEEKIEKPPSHDLLVDIAAAVLECDPEEIKKNIHRGKAL